MARVNGRWPGQLRRSVASHLLWMNIGVFLEKFGLWAIAQADIEGVALVGSHAREAATEESDVDLMILVTNPKPYLANLEWLSTFGEIERSQNETWGPVE